jgi:hypothetical protein
MISANVFARHASIWNQVTPTLEQVVRWANSERISLGRSVPSRSDPGRNSLISETAFRLARYYHVSAEPLPSDVELEARSFLTHLPRTERVAQKLTPEEWEEVYEIREKIISYTHWRPEIEFSPTIPGRGVVDQAIGDAVSGAELIEVKAVARPFRSSDFRQILTYGAMWYSAGKLIEKMTLVNPRNSYYFSSTLDFVAGGSSGRSAVELFQELVEWMIGLQVSA